MYKFQKLLKVIFLTVIAVVFFNSCGGEKEAKVVLIGNLRGEKPFQYSSITDTLLAKIEKIKPDYVFILGDNIQGFSEKNMEKEWDKFFLYIKSKITSPLYLVPGNHDVWDENSKEFYRKNIGKLHYYKDIAGIRFIVLNTVANNVREEISWAERVMKKKKKNIILMHTPLFLQDFWMEFVHPEIKDRVIYVIASDKYRYFYREIDGVKYIITGGGGGKFTVPEKFGGFYHFLLLNINKGYLNLSVVKKDTALEENCIPYDKVIQYEEINKSIGQPYFINNKIFLPVRTKKKTTFEINNSKYIVEGEKTLVLPAYRSLTIKIFLDEKNKEFYKIVRVPESLVLINNINKIKLTPYGSVNLKIDSMFVYMDIEWDSDTLIYSHETPLKYDYVLFLFENKDINKITKKSERLSFLLVPDIEEPEFIRVYPSEGMHPDVSKIKVEIRRENKKNYIRVIIPLNAVALKYNQDFSMNLIIKTGKENLFISSPEAGGKMAYIRRKNG